MCVPRYHLTQIASKSFTIKFQVDFRCSFSSLLFFSRIGKFSGQSGQEMTETQNISTLFVVVRSAGRKGHEWLDAHAVSMFTCWLLCLAQSLSVEHVMREIFRILICTSSSDKAEKRRLVEMSLSAVGTQLIFELHMHHTRASITFNFRRSLPSKR